MRVVIYTLFFDYTHIISRFLIMRNVRVSRIFDYAQSSLIWNGTHSGSALGIQ